MDPVTKFLENAPALEARLGYAFRDQQLLLLAFTHRSFVNEYRDLVPNHNERLEFLGDSVLGILIADYLYRQRPDTPEGELSQTRSHLVQADACVRYIEQLDVSEALLLGKGERMSGARGKETIQADLFEAIIGAIFLDGGYEAASSFLFGQLGNQIDALMQEPGRNWKAELQDLAQRSYQQMPVYRVTSETGPDHQKQFVITVLINDEVVGRGEGSSKKQAQQCAAEDALKRMSRQS